MESSQIARPRLQEIWNGSEDDHRKALRRMFEEGGAQAITDSRTRDIVMECWECFVLERSIEQPEEPDPHTQVGRVLSADKFLEFLERPHFYFAHPFRFEDKSERSIPEKLFKRLFRETEIPQINGYDVDQHHEPSGFVSEKTWHKQLREHRPNIISTPGISCWTYWHENQIERGEPVVDELLWHKYSGGRPAVGIRASYKTIKKVLTEGLRVNCSVCEDPPQETLERQVEEDPPVRGGKNSVCRL